MIKIHISPHRKDYYAIQLPWQFFLEFYFDVYMDYVPWRNGIDDLLVHGPNFVPLHEYNRSGRPLSQDELFEGLDGQATTNDATNGWETGIIPPFDVTAVDEPSQFSLGHHLE